MPSLYAGLRRTGRNGADGDLLITLALQENGGHSFCIFFFSEKIKLKGSLFFKFDLLLKNADPYLKSTSNSINKTKKKFLANENKIIK